MQLIWHETAIRDVERFMLYIAERNPAAARGQLREIRAQIQRLADFPRSGRIGRSPGTCELVVTRTSFLVVYRVEENVELIRVLHGAQQWPPVDGK